MVKGTSAMLEQQAREDQMVALEEHKLPVSINYFIVRKDPQDHQVMQ